MLVKGDECLQGSVCHPERFPAVCRPSPPPAVPPPPPTVTVPAVLTPTPSPSPSASPTIVQTPLPVSPSLVMSPYNIRPLESHRPISTLPDRKILGLRTLTQVLHLAPNHLPKMALAEPGPFVVKVITK